MTPPPLTITPLCSVVVSSDDVSAYLNDPAVRAALHVSEHVADKPWAECDDLVNGMWSFSDYLSDTTPLYAAVFAHPHKPKGFKMLVFSGDVDGVRHRDQ